MTLPAFAAKRRAAAPPQQSAGASLCRSMSCTQGARQQTRRTPHAAAVE